MNKALVFTLVLLVIAGLFSGCIVRTRGGRVHVHWGLIHGLRVLLIPAYVVVGTRLVIDGHNCVVTAVDHHRIRVRYPRGRHVWINVRIQ